MNKNLRTDTAQEQARIVLITGDGKGKTTSSLGMALRSVGHQMPVLMLQFVKDDDETGELAASKMLDNFEIVQLGKGFIPRPESSLFEQHCKAAQEGLERARQATHSGDYAVIILDEICVAVAQNLIAEADVLALLDDLPPGLCLILTGRGAPAALIDRADTVSQVNCIKHAMEEGRPAQKGVEL